MVLEPTSLPPLHGTKAAAELVRMRTYASGEAATRQSGLRHAAVIVGLALVGWALRAATMGIGTALVGLHVALVVHAVAAPIIFAAISLVYFKRFA